MSYIATTLEYLAMKPKTIGLTLGTAMLCVSCVASQVNAGSATSSSSSTTSAVSGSVGSGAGGGNVSGGSVVGNSDVESTGANSGGDAGTSGGFLAAGLGGTSGAIAIVAGTNSTQASAYSGGDEKPYMTKSVKVQIVQRECNEHHLRWKSQKVARLKWEACEYLYRKKVIKLAKKH